MKIIAKDGVDGFKTADECLEYEDALDAAERERKVKEQKLNDEMEQRFTELENLFNEYINKKKEFEKDYCVNISTNGYISCYNGFSPYFKFF